MGNMLSDENNFEQLVQDIKTSDEVLHANYISLHSVERDTILPVIELQLTNESNFIIFIVDENFKQLILPTTSMLNIIDERIISG
jgi:hypothetical protein